MVEQESTSSPREEHRTIAGRFTELVVAAPAGSWDDPSPVPAWRARDVVAHLVDWLPAFLEAGAGVRLPRGPSVDDDPVGAWEAHRAGVQALLDDPASHDRLLTNPHVGELPLDDAIDRFYTSDVFLHTWDLARATGQEPALDPARCTTMLAGMEPMDDLLRSSGQYGPRVAVSPDADAESRLVAFIGRDPAWAPRSGR